MDLNDFKEVELTEEDFNLIVKALGDTIKLREVGRNKIKEISSLIQATMPGIAANGAKQAEKEAITKADREIAQLEESTTLLKAKLIKLKRILAGNNLLKQAKDLL